MWICSHRNNFGMLFKRQHSMSSSYVPQQNLFCFYYWRKLILSSFFFSPYFLLMFNLKDTIKKKKSFHVLFSSVQSLSHVQFFATPWIAARRASLSITNSQSLLKLLPIESVMPSSHLILCRPLLLLPPIPPSIRVFSNESNLLMRWPKYCSFSFSISPSNEHPGLISFRMDWLDLLAVQGTLKSLCQHRESLKYTQHICNM